MRGAGARMMMREKRGEGVWMIRGKKCFKRLQVRGGDNLTRVVQMQHQPSVQ
jgi:hypothetical protein